MLTFPNITPAVFEAVLNELRQSSTVTENVPGYFTVEGSGIRAKAALYPGGNLYVDIEDKPFYVSETMIGSKIRAAITTAQAAIARQGGAV